VAYRSSTTSLNSVVTSRVSSNAAAASGKPPARARPGRMCGTGQTGATVPLEAPTARTEKVARRIRRTRQSLRGALLSLIMEKGYQRVSVQDIIDRADVGRSTFYAHFRDKEDLLVYGLEELRGAFRPRPRTTAEASRSGRSAPSPTLAVFEHFASYREVWRAMADRRGAETFTRHLHGFLTEMIRDQFGARAPEGGTQVPLDALVEFAVSTLIGLGMRWWMENDLPYSPDEVDRIYRRLTEPAIRAGLRPVE
jgi:AcrR family transcriptional regulator